MKAWLIRCFFVYYTSVFCASLPQPSLEDLSQKEGDRCLCVGENKDVSCADCYSRGAVWVREEGGKTYCYYRDETPSRVVLYRASFDSFLVSAVSMPCTRVKIQTLMNCRLDKNLHAKIYPSTPYSDIVCTLVMFIKQELSQSIRFFDNSLKAQFNSCSRFDCECCCRAEDRIICTQGAFTCGYPCGSVWTREFPAAIGLCYRPEDAMHTYSCYCCSLLDQSFWPENWDGVRNDVFSFAIARPPRYFFEFFREKSDFVTLVIKATLRGRGTSLNEFVWFAWHPSPCREEVAVAQGDRLLVGRTKEGAYEEGSAWLRVNNGSRVLRYLSRENVVFQYTPAAYNKPYLCDRILCTEEDLDHAWQRVVYGFILGN